MELRSIGVGDGPLLKSITLRSVEDAPYAFGGDGTLEDERRRPDAEWDDLAAECGGAVDAWRDRCVGYVIADGDVVCAKALAFLSGKEPALAHMSGVWVEPKYRRRGLGRRLVTNACEWAASSGAARLQLWVDDTNPAGGEFYRSMGFRATGGRRPASPSTPNGETAYELVLRAP
jgi:ribosomal protein S18 acetylase RimI-like enzyme